MPAKSYVKDNTISFSFEEDSIAKLQRISSDLGTSLMRFMRFDISEIDKLYSDAIKLSLNNSGVPLNEDRLLPLVGNIADNCPYLCFYSEMFFGVLGSIAYAKPYNMSLIFKRLSHIKSLDEKYSLKRTEEAKNCDAALNPYYDNAYLQSLKEEHKLLLLKGINNILYVKEAILLDIEKKRELLAKLIKETFLNSSTASPMSRLLATEEGGAFFEGLSFTVNLISIKSGENTELAEEYEINWLDDQLRFEMLKSAQRGVKIKECHNCGHYFAALGRVDTLYCDVPYKDTGKSCQEIGATRKYKEKTASNPVYDAYYKAYKRYNTRVRNGKMNKDDFFVWAEKARQERDRCLEGSLDLLEFSQWLGNKK